MDSIYATNLVKYWNEELEAGREYKKRFARPDTWTDYKNYYRGDWKTSTTIPVNRVFSFGRSMIPRTYFRSPCVTVTPTKPQFEWHAKLVETLDNYLIRELLLKKTLKRSILDAFHSGTGPIKLGFDSEFGYLPGQAALPGGETASQTSTKQENTLIEYRSNIKPGMPWAVAIPPTDIITPWGYREAEELPWITHEYLRPLRDVQVDSKYYKASREAVRGGFTYRADDPRRAMSSIFDRSKTPLCLIREIRDRKYKRVIITCEDQLLLEEEDVLQVEGLPFEFVIFNEDPDHFWGIPDVRTIEPQQLELNEIRTQAHKHRRLTMLKFLYLKGAITDEQIKKLTSEEVEGIEVVDTESLAAVVLPLQNHIPPDLWREAQEVLGDFRETVGFSRNQLGEYKSAGTPPTAHEVVAVQQANEIRNDERRDIVADVLVNIIRKWNQYIFKFWDEEKVMQVAGPDGVKHWIKFSGKELEGEYNLLVDPDSGLPVTRQIKQAQAEKLFGMFRMDPLVDQIELRRNVLQQYEIVDPTTPLLLSTPEAQALMAHYMAAQGGKGGGTPPGPGAGQKVEGSPSQPRTLNEVAKAGA